MLKAKETLTLDDLREQGHKRILMPSETPPVRVQELGINHEPIRRILVKDLQLYPYRIQIKQKLAQVDMEKQVAMSLVL